LPLSIWTKFFATQQSISKRRSGFEQKKNSNPENNIICLNINKNNHFESLKRIGPNRKWIGEKNDRERVFNQVVVLLNGW